MAQGKVVLGGGETRSPLRDRTSADARAEAERALASAEAAWQAGDPLTAMALASQSLQRGVPPDLEPRFREIRVRARASVVAEKIVRLRAVPVKDVVGDGDDVPVRIVVRNLAPAEFRSPQREPGSSDATFVLAVTREDRDVYGNVRTSDFTVRATVERDLSIPPGGEGEVQVTIGADLVALSHEGFSVLRIGGVFRPVVARVGQSEFFDALPIEPGTVRVLQKGWQQLAADPVTSLRRAITKRSPPHILAASELVAPMDRPEARTALREAMERDEPLAFCLKTALARLDELDAPPGGARP
jgi:hypothetical protein